MSIRQHFPNVFNHPLHGRFPSCCNPLLSVHVFLSIAYLAFIAVHGSHHVFQDRIEALVGLFWVTAGQEFHGTLRRWP